MTGFLLLLVVARLNSQAPAWCSGDSTAHADGTIAGFVRDPDNGEPIAKATVTVRWRAIALDSSRPRAALETRVDTVRENGAYALCDVPAGAPLEIRVNASGRRAISGEIVLPAAGALRRDFYPVEMSLTHGPATLIGRAEYVGGKPLESGRAGIPGVAFGLRYFRSSAPLMGRSSAFSRSSCRTESQHSFARRAAATSVARVVS